MVILLTESKIEEVPRTYNGQTVKKIRFIVIDPNSGSSQEKFFDVGKKISTIDTSKTQRRTYAVKNRKDRRRERYAVYTNRSLRIRL